MAHFTDQTDIIEEREYIRNSLIGEISSDSARKLIYRLSMLSCNFPREVALRIGKTPPPIELSGEVFDGLVGPWVEQVDEDEFRISPLISKIGEKVFDKDELSELHISIVLSILKTKHIDILQIGEMLFHAVSSKSETAFGPLIAVFVNIKEHEFEKAATHLKWFSFVALEEGQWICPASMHTEAFIRYYQLRISLYGDDSVLITKSYGKMIKAISTIESGDIEEMLYVMAYTALLNNFSKHVPSSLSVDVYSKFVDLAKSNPSLHEQISNIFSAAGSEVGGSLTPHQAFAGMIALRIGDSADYLGLLNSLDLLNVEKRELLFSPADNNEIEFSDAIVNASWVNDSNSGGLDIERNISDLSLTLEYAKKWKISDLAVSAVIAISVLRNEYDDDSTSAIEVLNSLDSSVKTNGKVLYQQAKIEFNSNNYQSALDGLKMAIASGDLKPMELTLATRQAGISAANIGNWKLAKKYFLDAEDKASDTSLYGSLSVGLRVEAIYADWNIGEQKEAILQLMDVLGELKGIAYEGCRKKRHLHAVVRHFVAWLHGIVFRNATDLKEPFPGFFSSLDPSDEIDTFTVLDIGIAWGFLREIALKLKVDSETQLGADVACSVGIPLFFLIKQAVEVFKEEWTDEQFKDSVTIIVDLFRANYSITKLDGDDTFICEPLYDLPDSFWEDDKIEQLIMILISVCIKRLSNCSEKSGFSIPSTEWRDGFTSLGIAGERLTSFFNRLEGLDVSQPSSLVDHAADAIFSIISTKNSPKKIAEFHFRLLNFACSPPYDSFCGNELARLMSCEWSSIAKKQPFALIAPQLYGPEIEESCNRVDFSGCQKAATILRVAIEATGAQFSAGAIEMINKISNKKV